MANFKPISYLVAALVFITAQNTFAVGLGDIPNAHRGKFLPEASSLGSVLIDGEPHLRLRLRHEELDDDISAGSPIASADRAEQLTARIAAGWTTARYHGFYFRGEVEVGRPLGSDRALNLDDDFRIPPLGPGPNPIAGNRAFAGHAVIPDNEYEEFNEVYLGWRSHMGGCPNSPDPCNGNTSAKLGRQEIIYDNHRWVGNILWRNNFQSYDAFRFDNTSIKNLSFSYAYLNKVKRTFGEKSIFNEWKMDDSHLINVSYTFPDIGKLVGYAYLLDFDDNPRTPFVEGTGAAPPFIGPTSYDSDTIGARWTGKHAIGDSWDLLTEFEWANQDPSNDADDVTTPAPIAVDFEDNDYYNIELGVRFGGTRVDGLGLMPIGEPTFQIKVGQEVLEGGGDGKNAVQTPLATFHAFQGWADKFIAPAGGTDTPRGGIKDTSVNLEILGLFGSVIGKNKINIVYHDYEADKTFTGPNGRISDYGKEWNLLWGKPDLFGMNGLLGAIKYANYSEDCGTGAGSDPLICVDTEKFWLMLQYTYQ
ncbi:MAG: alginate export family protein [Gammaproteobacteria bacterium]|nr:alginate export family protein [Gammaproteobacteria bacterium]